MQNFSSETVKKLSKELERWSTDDKLTELYTWPLDERLLGKLQEKCARTSEWLNDEWLGNLKRPGESSFKKTLRLRESIKGKPFNTELSKWIIEDWGGITTGKNDESLKACINRVESFANDDNNAESKIDFDRIASWSKHIAFRKPEKYAIYDARVIYSLNWLLFKVKAESKKYFPAPSGRNSVMELLDYSILLYIKHYKTEGIERNLKEDIDARNSSPKRKSRIASKLRKGLFLDEKEAFGAYCELLKKVSKGLYPDDDLDLVKVEMLLFSLADKYIALDVLKGFSELLSPNSNFISQKVE